MAGVFVTEQSSVVSLLLLKLAPQILDDYVQLVHTIPLPGNLNVLVRIFVEQLVVLTLQLPDQIVFSVVRLIFLLLLFLLLFDLSIDLWLLVTQ